MRRVSFFRRYLLFHFLSLVLAPLMLLMLVFGVYPFPDQNSTDPANSLNGVSVLIGLMLLVFVIGSWLFFYRLRKQLIRLQKAMSVPADGSWIPAPVSERDFGMDEMGQLATSFNRMIQQLRDSRLREQEEEQLRRQLIANLSHDLRTPLTALRGQAARLQKEKLSPAGSTSLAAVDRTITHISELMEAQLSYTLLTAGKYPYCPVPTEMLGLIRKTIATWYPAFEDAGFHIEIAIPETAAFSWQIDPGWMRRILDHLLQNVLRHADVGRYIRIAVDVKQERITIEDHGPGIDAISANRGAGIGLQMTQHMIKEMKLYLEIVSGVAGTTMCMTNEIISSKA